MRTVAILLCDNDFGSMFLKLAESIKLLQNYWGNELTEQRVEAYIRAAIPAFYAGFNNWNFEGYDETGIYLNKTIKILFNEAAEKAILELDHDGGSWYYCFQTQTASSF